jgi:phosphoribosyl-ATP pyrophosphohydrolase
MSSFTIYDAARLTNQRFAKILSQLNDEELDKLRAKCAKKLGEEGVELCIETLSGSRERFTEEAADLMLRYLNALAVSGIRLEMVEAELKKRMDSFWRKDFPNGTTGSS